MLFFCHKPALKSDDSSFTNLIYSANLLDLIADLLVSVLNGKEEGFLVCVRKPEGLRGHLNPKTYCFVRKKQICIYYNNCYKGLLSSLHLYCGNLKMKLLV